MIFMTIVYALEKLMAEIFYIEVLYNTVMLIQQLLQISYSYSFVGYNPHMLNVNFGIHSMTIILIIGVGTGGARGAPNI